MKKLFLLAAAAVISVSIAHAQNRVASQTPGEVPSRQSKVYCEIIGVQKLLSLKVNVQVDFGQNPYVNSKLVDENGKNITFNSMVDAMNYMSKLGWEFESVYVVTHGSGSSAQNVYHWLLSKYIQNDEHISDGFTTKRQFKEMRQTQEGQPQE